MTTTARAPRLMPEPDMGHMHRTIESLGHVINRQSGDASGHQRQMAGPQVDQLIVTVGEAQADLAQIAPLALAQRSHGQTLDLAAGAGEQHAALAIHPSGSHH